MASTKTRSVLHRRGATSGMAPYVYFERQPADDPETTHRTVLLDVEDWHELGDPEVITITIRPGDHLNKG